MDTHESSLSSSTPHLGIDADFEDTVTVLSPLAPDEWSAIAPRFLFLEPPADCVKYVAYQLIIITQELVAINVNNDQFTGPN